MLILRMRKRLSKRLLNKTLLNKKPRRTPGFFNRENFIFSALTLHRLNRIF
jgi:hypothetical protein